VTYDRTIPGDEKTNTLRVASPVGKKGEEYFFVMPKAEPNAPLLKFKSAEDFVESFKAAHAKKDIEAMAKLVYWEGVPEILRSYWKEKTVEEFEYPIKTIDFNNSTEIFKDAKFNLPCTHSLNVTYEFYQDIPGGRTHTISKPTYPIGKKGEEFFIIMPKQAKFEPPSSNLEKASVKKSKENISNINTQLIQVKSDLPQEAVDIGRRYKIGMPGVKLTMGQTCVVDILRDSTMVTHEEGVEATDQDGNKWISKAVTVDGTKVNAFFMMSASQLPESGKEPKPRNLLPPFREELQGSNPVRVKNPNSFAVSTGLRSGQKGVNFDVPANGEQTVYVPNGRYDIYFVYSDKPEALFQGDSFTLNDNGVEIQIVKVVNGNYNIRQVK
jgi:hypothetical protein